MTAHQRTVPADDDEIKDLKHDLPGQRLATRRTEDATRHRQAGSQQEAASALPEPPDRLIDCVVVNAEMAGDRRNGNTPEPASQRPQPRFAGTPASSQEAATQPQQPTRPRFATFAAASAMCFHCGQRHAVGVTQAVGRDGAGLVGANDPGCWWTQQYYGNETPILRNALRTAPSPEIWHLECLNTNARPGHLSSRDLRKTPDVWGRAEHSTLNPPKSRGTRIDRTVRVRTLNRRTLPLADAFESPRARPRMVSARQHHGGQRHERRRGPAE